MLFQELIEEKGARITIDPLPLIEANASMMHQLFENLITNGLQYARQGAPSDVHPMP